MLAGCSENPCLLDDTLLLTLEIHALPAPEMLFQHFAVVKGFRHPSAVATVAKVLTEV